MSACPTESQACELPFRLSHTTPIPRGTFRFNTVSINREIIQPSRALFVASHSRRNCLREMRRHSCTVRYLPSPCAEMQSLPPKSAKVSRQNNVVRLKNNLKYITPTVACITEIITDIM